jgi:DNA-binding LacI/PurR family transcriptional regulator
MARVTIKDIATKAGVSPMTVSNVINGKSARVSEKTIEKINQVITELDYKPNMSARSLVSNKSRMIAVIVPLTESGNDLLLSNPFYAEFINGLESSLRELGYSLIIASVDQSGKGLVSQLQWNVDGLVLLGFFKDELFHYVKKQNLPTLLADSYIDDPHFLNLRLDDESASYEATKYLIEKGHRSIAHITGTIREGGVLERRIAGYQRALLEAGVEYQNDWLIEGTVSFAHGQNSAETLIKTPEVSAAYCTADLIAAGLIAGLHQRGKRIPEDYSVMGFDNTSIASMVWPALTTVDQGILSKGKLAGKLITDSIAGKPVDNVTYCPYKIHEQDSVIDMVRK